LQCLAVVSQLGEHSPPVQGASGRSQHSAIRWFQLSRVVVSDANNRTSFAIRCDPPRAVLTVMEGAP
jgi:hypothetical protein